ncbi:DNA N-6-adenine-methyltransferase [Acinetobacter soli]|uniref:DNA N-6-adenine-methyltransferase n=1 Tax=Acinetobacter soli TaxID=487316 RepID=UPI00124E4469|nr:DNA N-6-adenine-methyltransferase [Acinetobacter soli]
MNTMAKQQLFGLAENRTDIWATPQHLFNKLNAVFNFTLDVCALPENAKCRDFYTPELDGLKQEWTGTCWMNPPYGREIIDWVAKAAETAKQGHTVVALVPVRTDARWFQDYCLGREIHYIRGRLKFGNATSNAPFGCCVVVYRPSLNDVQW